MNLALRDNKVHALEDLTLLNPYVQVYDFEFVSHDPTFSSDLSGIRQFLSDSEFTIDSPTDVVKHAYPVFDYVLPISCRSTKGRIPPWR